MRRIDNDIITFFEIINPEKPLMVPFIERTIVKAGFPSPAADYIAEPIDFKKLLIKNPSATFMINVKGDSMIESYIPDGARLIIDKSLHPRNNDIILAVLNGEFYVKHYVRKGDDVFLVPGNQKYQTTEILDGMEFVCFGVVTFILTDTRAVNNVRTRRL